MAAGVWVALISTGLAGGSLWASQRQRRRLAHLLASRPTTLAELQGLQADVAQEIGAGAFRERVKLQGMLLCEQPLTAPFSGEPCVAYASRIVELYEELVEDTDQEGNQNRRWQNGEHELSSESRRCGFQLGQGQLKASVDPEGAELEMQAVFNRTEPANWAGLDAASGFGAAESLATSLLASASLVGSGSDARSDGSLSPGTRRRLGFRREESIFPAHGELFLVAEASDLSGALRLQKPSGEGLFMIRRGGEEQLQQQLRQWARIWSWVAVLLAVVAVVAALSALLS